MRDQMLHTKCLTNVPHKNGRQIFHAKMIDKCATKCSRKMFDKCSTQQIVDKCATQKCYLLLWHVRYLFIGIFGSGMCDIFWVNGGRPAHLHFDDLPRKKQSPIPSHNSNITNHYHLPRKTGPKIIRHPIQQETNNWIYKYLHLDHSNVEC